MFTHLIPSLTGKVAAGESLFVSGDSSSSGRSKRAVSLQYDPQFVITWSSPEEEVKAVAMCASNYQCLWDYYATNDSAVAANTLDVEDTYVEELEELGRY